MTEPQVREVLPLGETPAGKHLEFVRQGRIARIQFREGGQLPECLTGGWTDFSKAESAVKGYLHSLKKGKEPEPEPELDAQTNKPPVRRRRTTAK